MDTGYGLRGEPHEWQGGEVLPKRSVGDSTECIPGFGADDLVMVDGRVVVGASRHEQPVVRPTVLFGDGSTAPRSSLREGVFARLEAQPVAASMRAWRCIPAAAVLAAFGFIPSLVLPTAHAADQTKNFDEEIARKYAGVTAWQGFWESSETRASSRSNDMGYTQKAYEAVSHGRFELTRARDGWTPKDGNFTWTGTGETSGTTSESMSSWSKSGPRMVGEDWQISGGGRGTTRQVEFSVSMGRQLASLHAGGGTGKVAPTRKVGHAVIALSSGDGRHHYEEKAIEETWSAALMEFFIPNYEKETKNWVVAQGDPGVLAFEHEELHHVSIGGLRRSRVVLAPVYDDLEVEVTIEGYEEWRPKGSIADPTKPGNALVARAVLKSKDGKTKELPEVERFRFELIDTSREPGVCLNWPLAAKDENYDLKFVDLTSGNTAEQLTAVRKFFADWGLTSSGDYDLESMPAGGVSRLSFADISEDGQRAELTEPPRDDAGQPFAEAAIECFDFGAKAELRVTCILNDGRELLGLMKGEDGEQDLVRLPKRAGPDWVAENWRRENEVLNLAASDDNEKVEGQPMNGDGFTLYEEYRGWVENGKHIQGDPKAKDFFVLNLIGADAKGGIALFERASKLRVHAKLRPTEIIVLSMRHTESEAHATGERIMNLNHCDAPHRVDQHGVTIVNTSGFRSSGAETSAVINDDKVNRAFRPGKVQMIRVEEPGRIDGVFSSHASTSDYNLSARDAAFAYDRAVAHELLHAVGVDHHGEGEVAATFYFQGAGDPMNPTRRARFVRRMPPSESDFASRIFGRPAVWSDFDRGPTVTLRWEDTGEDVAQSLSEAFERELTAERENPIYDHGGAERAAQFPQYGKDAGFWTEMQLYNDVTSGATRRGRIEGSGRKFSRWVTIGRERQADSGNEHCLMRYYFANAYPVGAQDDAFYLVRPGGNRAGREICRSPEGTGANAPSHTPKSRFGDSAPGRGSCFQYICPNDAIPPRTL